MVSMPPYISNKHQLNKDNNNNYIQPNSLPQINTSILNNSQNSIDLKPFPIFKSNSKNSNSTNPCLLDNKLYSVTSQSFNKSLEQMFKALFGAEISEWPYSEESLQKALELRISQECTKQEYYKVERMNRVIEIMKLAAISKVPGHLIPSLIDTKETQPYPESQFLKSPSSTSSTRSCFQNNSLPLSPPSSANSTSPPSPSPVRTTTFKHSRGHTISNLLDLKNDNDNNNLNNSNSNPMNSFKFGSGSAYKNNNLINSHIQKKRTTLPPKHQLSPSRIGAHAISSLHRHGGNRLSIDLSNLRHGSNHNRTLSLPSTVSIPEKKQMDFHSNNHTVTTRKNNFNEIVIPDLSIKSKLNNIVNVNDDDNDNNDDNDDVEKLLNNPQYIRKHRKQLSSSPLREVTLVDDCSENVTITEMDEDDSIVDFSISNISGFCSSPNKSIEIEPKTP